MIWLMAALLGILGVGGPPLSAQPTIPEPQFQAAYRIYLQGDYLQALTQLETWMQAGVADPRVYYLAGYAYYQLKDWARARKAFEKAYRLDPDFSPRFFRTPPAAP